MLRHEKQVPPSSLRSGVGMTRVTSGKVGWKWGTRPWGIESRFLPRYARVSE